MNVCVCDCVVSVNFYFWGCNTQILHFQWNVHFLFFLYTCTRYVTRRNSSIWTEIKQDDAYSSCFLSVFSCISLLFLSFSMRETKEKSSPCLTECVSAVCCLYLMMIQCEKLNLTKPQWHEHFRKTTGKHFDIRPPTFVHEGSNVSLPAFV